MDVEYRSTRDRDAVLFLVRVHLSRSSLKEQYDQLVQLGPKGVQFFGRVEGHAFVLQPYSRAGTFGERWLGQVEAAEGGGSRIKLRRRWPWAAYAWLLAIGLAAITTTFFVRSEGRDLLLGLGLVSVVSLVRWLLRQEAHRAAVLELFRGPMEMVPCERGAARSERGG